VIIIFELTGDYAIALAAGISNLSSRDTIYTLKLRRRGIDIMRGRGANLMQLLTVADAMQPLPASLPAGTPLNEAIARLAGSPSDGLPVVDTDGRYLGTLGSQQIEQAMRENDLDARAADLAQDLPPLTQSETLEDALGALLRARSGLPVLATPESGAVGWLTHLDVLRAYNTRLQQGLEQARRHDRRPARDATWVGSALARLRGYRIVDLELATSRPPVGQTISEIAWPPGSTVLAIQRGDESFEPDGEDRLRRGDRLSLLVPSTAADRLVDTITRAGNGNRGPDDATSDDQ
jgi:CIC family chloride channel protein